MQPGRQLLMCQPETPLPLMAPILVKPEYLIDLQGTQLAQRGGHLHSAILQGDGMDIVKQESSHGLPGTALLLLPFFIALPEGVRQRELQSL